MSDIGIYLIFFLIPSPQMLSIKRLHSRDLNFINSNTSFLNYHWLLILKTRHKKKKKKENQA